MQAVQQAEQEFTVISKKVKRGEKKKKIFSSGKLSSWCRMYAIQANISCSSAEVG
jgi:hypothetical protein